MSDSSLFVTKFKYVKNEILKGVNVDGCVYMVHNIHRNVSGVGSVCKHIVHVFIMQSIPLVLLF